MPQESKRRKVATGDAPPGPWKKRGYGHTCAICRERKIKCVGADTPPCKPCREANTLCRPAERVRVTKKRAAESAAVEAAPSSSSAHHPAAESLLQLKGEREETIAVPVSLLASLEARIRKLEGRDSGPASPTPAEPQLGSPRYDVGSAAHPVYHGEISMFDEGAEARAASASASPEVRRPDEGEWSDETLRAAARLKHRYASAHDGENWVESYFCWASSVDGVVHRPSFIRDMALDGLYFSDFLLVAIYVTGIRFTTGMDERERELKGAHYEGIAMSMLPEQIMNPGSISTIHGMLVLAGRQMGVGKIQQAWMIFGLAIRMMQDMGLHLPVSDPSKFSSDELDMRARLFWGVYAWDKTLSMALGREPSLTHRPGLSTNALPSDTEDSVEWAPHLPGVRYAPYPRQPLLKTFTLGHYAHLMLILESILNNMYSPGRPHRRSLGFVQSAVDQLAEWRASLPSVLMLESGKMPDVCPPPNVVVLNMCYHTIRILVYRPLLADNARPANSSRALNTSSTLNDQTALHHCRDAAINISEILQMWGRTFGHYSHHYTILYGGFIASCLDILLIRSAQPAVRDEALDRVKYVLEVLEQCVAQGGCVRKGVINIRSQLDRVTKASLSPRQEAAVSSSNEAGARLPVPPTPDFTAQVANVALQGLPAGAGQVWAPENDFGWFTDGNMWDMPTLLDMLAPGGSLTQEAYAQALGMSNVNTGL
ncbi:hypothetical protein Q8F55_007244 [Vanrija albida]|uniref:Zn(2)-C6 fungal-type domain-containing protein n=1 Tax=Vanrija albida TaxID=181172 RepID=A0ABR3PZC6_9TREE